MANTTKHIVGGPGKKRLTKKKKKGAKKKPSYERTPKHLDLSPNKPGKYGIDY